jgi:hypothetical protein
MLRLRIKCMRLENIYNYSDSLKAFRKEKEGQSKLSLAPNLARC